MKVAIHQPNFLPWLGYFQKIAWSDIFVLFDDVQVPRGKSYVNRVKICRDGRDEWLTIPIKGRSRQPPILEVEIASDGPWQRKLLGTLEFAYQRTPHFGIVFPEIKNIVLNDYGRIFELNKALIEFVCSGLELRTKLVQSSMLGRSAKLNGEDKILAILEELGASSYLSGSGGGSKRYLVEKHFQEREISLTWQNFQHPEYEQDSSNFVSHLSIVDVLMNVGFDKTRKLIEFSEA